ncbi:MAG: hypothetical protein ACI95T_000499 [Flavobacteriales bacterium]
MSVDFFSISLSFLIGDLFFHTNTIIVENYLLNKVLIIPIQTRRFSPYN